MRDLTDDLIYPRYTPSYGDFDDFTDPPEDTLDAPDDSQEDLSDVVEDLVKTRRD